MEVDVIDGAEVAGQFVDQLPGLHVPDVDIPGGHVQAGGSRTGGATAPIQVLSLTPVLPRDIQIFFMSCEYNREKQVLDSGKTGLGLVTP